MDSAAAMAHTFDMLAPPPPLPDWIDPRARLRTPAGTVDAAALADLAHRIGDAAGPAPCPLAVGPSCIATLVASLIAAERRGTPIHLVRGDGWPSGSLRVTAGGGICGDPGAVPTLTGFHVVMETSGTTGTPKRLRHGLDRLLARVPGKPVPGAVWLLTYDPCGFAGMQVILTALRGGGTLVADPGADAAGLARLALDAGATHAGGTPSFWRALLLTGARPPLRAITLGGERVDQPLLDALRTAFPAAALRHIYASTEAGSLFAVTDGREGFPAVWLETGVEGTDLRIVDGVLHVRSARAADGIDGWLETGDLVDVAGDRVLFRGRADSTVNVGGVKVRPEEVERHLLAVPGVADAAVRAVASPITGALLTADIVADPEWSLETLRDAVRARLADLPPAHRPRRIAWVDRLDLMPSGKKKRMEGAS